MPQHETRLLGAAADPGTTRDETSLQRCPNCADPGNPAALRTPTLPMPRLDRCQSANVDLKHRKHVQDHSLQQSRAILGGQGKDRKRASGYDKTITRNNQMTTLTIFCLRCGMTWGARVLPRAKTGCPLESEGSCLRQRQGCEGSQVQRELTLKGCSVEASNPGDELLKALHWCSMKNS